MHSRIRNPKIGFLIALLMITTVTSGVLLILNAQFSIFSIGSCSNQPNTETAHSSSLVRGCTQRLYRGQVGEYDVTIVHHKVKHEDFRWSVVQSSREKKEHTTKFAFTNTDWNPKTKTWVEATFLWKEQEEAYGAIVVFKNGIPIIQTADQKNVTPEDVNAAIARGKQALKQYDFVLGPYKTEIEGYDATITEHARSNDQRVYYNISLVAKEKAVRPRYIEGKRIQGSIKDWVEIRATDYNPKGGKAVLKKITLAKDPELTQEQREFITHQLYKALMQYLTAAYGFEIADSS